MKEEQKKDEESLEEILDEMTEEELDKKLEEVLENDILSEDEVKVKFSHMNTALVGDNVSTLKGRGIIPIENLEEKLIEDDEDEKELITQDIIKYGIEDEEGIKNHYTKPEIGNVSYDENKIRPRDELEKVQSTSLISSEMAFVEKSMKPQYIKPKEFVVGEEKKENKGFIQDFKKLSDDYKTG